MANASLWTQWRDLDESSSDEDEILLLHMMKEEERECDAIQKKLAAEKTLAQGEHQFACNTRHHLD